MNQNRDQNKNDMSTKKIQIPLATIYQNVVAVDFCLLGLV